MLNLLVDIFFLVYLHHQNKPKIPGEQSIKHIRRLSKAITGALYPVLSDYYGQSFFDIPTASHRYDNCLTFNHYVMMEKKYQLVAWTQNITDKENARLYVIPSVKLDLSMHLIKEVAECHKLKEKDGGHISSKLARRFIRAYDQSARFEILTGYIDQAIRFFLQAADYCIWEDGDNWTYWDSDLGSYCYFCGKLRDKFIWYCEKAISLAGKYGFEHILEEKDPKRTMEHYWEQTQMERDLERHLKEMSVWQ